MRFVHFGSKRTVQSVLLLSCRKESFFKQPALYIHSILIFPLSLSIFPKRPSLDGREFIANRLMNKKIPKSELSNENVIKAGIINYFARKNRKPFCVCNELTFSSKKKVADLIFCKDDTSIGIEIKAHNDDFRRIRNQLPIYCKLFDFVYVAITANHIGKIGTIPNTIGIILFSDKGKVSYLRKAHRNHVDIAEILLSMPVYFIRTSLSNNKYIRKDNKNFNKRLAHQIFIKYLRTRCRWTNMDLCTSLHYEDITVNTNYIKL